MSYPAVLATLLALARSQMEQLTERLQRKEIDSNKWQIEMLHLITRFTTAAMMLGIGNESLTDAERQQIASQVSSQLAYLRDFKQAIDDAPEFNASWIQRAGMYGDAIQIVYWQGLMQEGNWQWHYEPGANHCGDCVELNGQVHDVDYWTKHHLPGDGRTQCLTACRCWLTQV